MMNTTITLRSNDPEKITTAVEWCNEQFGKDRYDLVPHWPAKFMGFAFKDQMDAALFSLRWSGQT
jgi:hypothetical protein